jgi:hypothetical protein
VTSWVRRVVTVMLVVLVASPIAVSDARSRPRRSHQLLFLPVLATIRSPSGPSTPPIDQAIAACDVAQVTRLGVGGTRLPNTPPAQLAAASCAVLPVLHVTFSRLFVAPLAGSPALGTPPGLSGHDVRRVSTSLVQGHGWEVNLTLTQAGLAKFNALAAERFPHAAPGNEVAIVFDGLVYSSPAFQAPSFSGPFEITGNFSAKQASQLAGSIRSAI